MPDVRETFSRTRHGDYTQVTTLDTEEGSLRVTITGPAGGVELEVESPEDLPMQVRQLDELAAAVADARAVLAPLLENAEGGQL